MTNHRTYLTMAALTLLSILVFDSRAREVVDYFTVERGNMPLILCAPHRGMEDVPGLTKRKSGLFKSDGNTDRVAIGLSKEIAKLTGKKPYLVVAKIRRDEIDFNRPALPEHEPFGGWEQAFTDQNAEKYWKFYHATIEAYLKDILTGSSADQLVLLLDIHGHARSLGIEDKLIFGDEYGASVTPLLRRYGTAAIDGPCSIMGIMASKGYRLLANVPQFAGGYCHVIYPMSDKDAGVSRGRLDR